MPGWPANPDWQRYVLGPTTPIARPVRIASTSGQIENAAALLTPEKGSSATLTRTANDSGPTNVVLDYGIDVGGLPTLDVTAASGSPQLRASYSESLPYLTLDGDKAPSHSADPHRYDTCTVNQTGTLTNAYVQGGERYQMISLTTPGTVSLGGVGIKIGFYCPGVDGYQGHFVCSDEGLNKIWYASAYTLQTNMLPPGSIAAPKLSGHNKTKTAESNALIFTSTDTTNVSAGASPAPPRNIDLLASNTIPVVVDGAKRDRSVWSGDLAVQGPVIYYSTGATEYMRESLRLLGSYGAADGRVSTNLPSEWPVGNGPTAASESMIFSANYTLWWVKALADYYLYTGDKEFLTEEWPILTRELDWSASQVGSDGLFATDKKNGHDWDYYDGPKVGAVTAYNALYYRVLIDSATLADDLGQDFQARKYRAEAAGIKEAINGKLFNSQTGVFDASNLERGGVAQDANVFATAFGLVPEDKAKSILAKLKEHLWTKYGPKPFSDAKYKPYISPYVTGFEVLARLRANDSENAIHLMSSLWGTMIAPGDFQSGAIWEAMSLDGKPGLGKSTSLSHGWAAMPAAALSSLVLGIQPVSAGYATWRIQPHPGDLQWAEGRAATPKGPIDVAWARARTTSQFDMRVSAPADTSGEIAVPAFGGRVAVFVNGRMVWNGGKANDSAAHGDGNYIYLDHVTGGTVEILTRPGD
jgi:Bacterial alpha-L-rhamnosidase 6 hairpin glycosidase domain/Bacterial alpha-L-rhamnosidase C-terminal domain